MRSEYFTGNKGDCYKIYQHTLLIKVECAGTRLGLSKKVSKSWLFWYNKVRGEETLVKEKPARNTPESNLSTF